MTVTANDTGPGSCMGTPVTTGDTVGADTDTDTETDADPKGLPPTATTGGVLDKAVSDVVIEAPLTGPRRTSRRQCVGRYASGVRQGEAPTAFPITPRGYW